MNEYLMILIMAVCGTLFAVGGTFWKPARRYGIPLFLAVIAVLSGVILWKSLAMGFSLIAALSMGYGDRYWWWMKAVVFSAYGASFLWIGSSLWVLLTPILCFGLFFLSNWKPTANVFFWKACEFMFGTLIGITFISVLLIL